MMAVGPCKLPASGELRLTDMAKRISYDCPAKADIGPASPLISLRSIVGHCSIANGCAFFPISYPPFVVSETDLATYIVRLFYVAEPLAADDDEDGGGGGGGGGSAGGGTGLSCPGDGGLK